MMMQLRSYDTTVFCIESQGESDTARGLKQQASRLLERAGDVVLDLRRAAMDSRGLSAILALQRQLELLDRKLLVVSDDPDFLSLLDRAGVPDVLALFADTEAALAHARKPARLAA
jgi:anti-anti-sigma regulatory factor